MKKRKTLPDIIRGVLIIMVILWHAMIYGLNIYGLESGSGGGILSNLFQAVQMPGFFLISGFFGLKKIEDIARVWKEMKKNIVSLLLPFVAWAFIVGTLIIGEHNRSIILAAQDLLYHVDHGLWFIWVLFVIRIVFIAVNRIASTRVDDVKRFTASLFSYAGIMVNFLVLAKLFGVNFLGLKFILYYGVFYYIGYVVCMFKDQFSAIERKIGNWLFPVCLAGGVLIVWNVDLVNVSDNLFGIFVRFIAGMFVFYILFCVCRKWQDELTKAKVNVIGRHTMELYVTHATLCFAFSAEENALFTVNGTVSFLTVVFWLIVLTLLVMAVLKSNWVTDLVFYGNEKNEFS